MTQARDFLAGGGEMGALMRSVDWSQTPLGPADAWPQSLKTSLSILLESRFPMMIGWGEGFLQFYNDAFRPILGASKHPSAMGTSTPAVFWEVWNLIEPMFEEVRAGRSVGFDDLLLPLNRNGYLEECYFQFSYGPIRDESGGVGGVLVTMAESTARVLAERRLRTLRDLTLTTPAPDEEGAWQSAASVLAANPADLPFALLYALDDEGGATARRIASPSPAPPWAPATLRLEDPSGWPLAQVVQTGRPAHLTALSRRRGRWVGPAWPEPVQEALVLPIPRLGGPRPWGFLIAGVSPRRRLDDDYRSLFSLICEQIAAAVARVHALQEERQRAESLIALDRAKTTFFSNVSHELRTPLTLILGPTEDLLAGHHGPLPAGAREALELLHRGGLRLQKLVNNLLDFSRIEAGRAEASFAPVDLASLTEGLVSEFRAAVERAGLTLTVECAPLGEPVYVDRALWEQIVFNLLSNALKFTFEGGIKVSLQRAGEQVELRVTDTGVGIPPDELPRLFERFHRVEGTRARSQEGSGIGLALTQELTRLHGGAITAQSALGVGTTFTVTLPLGFQHLPRERVSQPGASPAQAAPSPTATATSFVEEALRWSPEPAPALGTAPQVAPGAPSKRARLLLVDDNADLRRYLTQVLSPRWQVEAVEDGVKALASAWADPPDLVLTDLMMPELDGFELVRALRAHERTKSIPIVMLSARAEEAARIEGLQAGADDYLLKPFSAHELIARIHIHLELARLRGAAEAERAQLHGLFMNAPAFIAILKGPTHLLDFVNDLYVRLTGQRDLVGRPIREAFPELAGQGFFTLLDQVYRTGEPHVGREARIRLDRNGTGALEEAFVNFVFQPNLGLEGEVVGVSVFGFEVTEQVRARRAVQAAQDRLAFALDSAVVGHLDYDLDTRTTVRSATHDRIFGYPTLQPQWGLDTFLSHVAPGDRERVAGELDRRRRTGDEGRLEYRIVRADGQVRWISSHSRFERDEAGRPTHLVGILSDVTDSKQAELDREARLRELAETVRFSELFVGVLGHDLRNPLAAISAAAQLLLRRAEEEAQARPAARILSAVERMDRLISQVLDFTRARLGPGIPLRPRRVDLVQVCRPVLEELREGGGVTGQRAHGTLHLEVVGDVVGTWDGDRLAQVVSNLVGNALQHGRPGGPVTVRLCGERPDEVTLEVHNEGAVPAALLPKLFEPFHRGAEDHRPSGLGLGLFIARKIVQSHGGRLQVRSSEREGTHFIAHLPRNSLGDVPAAARLRAPEESVSSDEDPVDHSSPS